MRHPDMRLSLTLRDDKPPVTCRTILDYIHARWRNEKPSESWWTFAARVLQGLAGSMMTPQVLAIV